VVPDIRHSPATPIASATATSAWPRRHASCSRATSPRTARSASGPAATPSTRAPATSRPRSPSSRPPAATTSSSSTPARPPLLAAGYPDLFRWHAGKVAKALRRFRTIVINCSACLYTLRAQYPAEGVALPAEVLSLSEFLVQSAARLPRPKQRRAVYYHDPCYLARYAGVLEPPRRVLAQVAEVRELSWSRTDTECCGGAGVLPKTMPTVADAMAKKRLAEVASQGGGMVVTSCATCTFMLKRNAPRSVEVADLPTAVAELGDIAVAAPLTVTDDV
jgi:hypothetical protein